MRVLILILLLILISAFGATMPNRRLNFQPSVANCMAGTNTLAVNLLASFGNTDRKSVV